MAEDFSYPTPNHNKKSPKEKWNELYAEESYLFGKEPSPFLKSHLHQLQKSKVMDIGMGEGQNAVYLAEQGFEVSGIDASSRAVEKAQALAQEKGVKIEAKVQSLDFFLLPLLSFDTVVMSKIKPTKRFYSEILRGLKVGGTFLFEGYLVEEYKRRGGHKQSLLEFEDCYKPNEALNELRSFQILYYSEIPQGESHLVQALCKKTSS